MSKDFIPAKPAPWAIKIVQQLARFNLFLKNKIQLAEQDLLHFHRIPPGSGVILTSNHADEADPQVCFELSRRANKRFITMCNREAFDEAFGIPKFILPRLGVFSVKRGARDSAAVTYAQDVVKQGENVLVIFPEGEIYYLNEKIQPFHHGAVDICLKAIIEKRKTDPDWTAFIVPMAIKYHYDQSIEPELEKRIAKMETEMSIKPEAGATLPDRLLELQKAMLQSEERLYKVGENAETAKELREEIITAEHDILAEVLDKHPEVKVREDGATIDKAWQIEAELRKSISNEKDPVKKKDLELDLKALKEVAQLTSWHPHYYTKDPSADRLAEVVLKLEREIYKVQRPKQIASRNVSVKIAHPIDMGKHVDDYIKDPHTVRHSISERLQHEIQSLVSTLAAKLNGKNSH